MSKSNPKALLQWLLGRVGMVYVAAFLFCLAFVDFKVLDTRTKIRHLNDSIPDFADMIIFSNGPHTKNIDWKPYKYYFKLILRYMPDDLTVRQLLGFADYYTGQEKKAIDCFKGSSSFKGHDLFWSDYNLGVIYYKKGTWPQAADYLFKAITAPEQLAVALMQGSMVYRQIFASPFFKYSLQSDMAAARSKAYLLLLSSLQHMGQYEKMIFISRLALADPALSYKDAFYYYAGIAYYDIGQINQALLLFEQSLSIEKNDPDVYYYLAAIYGRAGRQQEARSFLQASYALHLKNDGRFPYTAHFNLQVF
ncbi:MAG: tetratricopeptide repeat protein [Candidatus Omnitrophica bacterium]|nr:tetratricopeptide repeat protein [Candidatus Omnitrophota bacterium]MDE2010132.1 tetratricopeptide repeat protein [Candidatus Omnitrophota bacterium]MDE2231068.1 tetratricopeptide repeat protein [Candidatus Omnitrophota bacterium]